MLICCCLLPSKERHIGSALLSHTLLAFPSRRLLFISATEFCRTSHISPDPHMYVAPQISFIHLTHYKIQALHVHLFNGMFHTHPSLIVNPPFPLPFPSRYLPELATKTTYFMSTFTFTYSHHLYYLVSNFPLICLVQSYSGCSFISLLGPFPRT